MSKIATVYSKDTCGFCVKAKHVLINSGYTIEERVLDKNGFTADKMFSELGKKVNSVPQVVINGDHIGGYKEVCEYVGV